MSEAKRNWREDLKVFRERMGGLTEEKKAYGKEQRETRKALQSALKAGPRTVPELARETNLPSHKVMWYLMAMKRYGELVEAGEAGDYVKYALKESER
jgi:predicted transcriptional regulator